MSDVIHSVCSGKKRQLQQQEKLRRRRRASRQCDSDAIPFLTQTLFIRKGSFISRHVRCSISGAQLDASACFCDACPLCQPLQADEQNYSARSMQEQRNYITTRLSLNVTPSARVLPPRPKHGSMQLRKRDESAPELNSTRPQTQRLLQITISMAGSREKRDADDAGGNNTPFNGT